MFPQELGLHEEIAEDRMSQIRPRSREHQLSVTRQLDGAFGVGMIRQSDSSHFDVVFRRNADFGVDFQVTSTLPKLGLLFAKHPLLTFARPPTRPITPH